MATKTAAQKEAEAAAKAEAKAKAAEEKAAAKATADSDKLVASGKATVAHVYDKNDECIRTYSEEVHGDVFLEYAESFASKVEGRRIVAE